MTIDPMKPLTAIDWTKVKLARVTLEKPYKGGGLRFRHGTTDAKKNLSYKANDPDSGDPYIPGAPVMYPEDMPAIAGNVERDSWLMTADIDATTVTRREGGRMGPGGDTTGHALFLAFGFFMAPLVTARGAAPGFTISDERTRVAAFWGWYKMPKGDGTMMPPMNRIAAPDVPHVAIRPLDRNMQPLKDANGDEVVIRPFEFWRFDDKSMYDELPETEQTAAQSENASLRAELAELRALIMQGVKNGK